MEADRVPELAQPRDRGDTFARGEVVEDGLGHQEVGRRDAVLGFELGHRERGVEREVDVVPEVDLAALGAVAEEREAVAAGLTRLEDLAVVVELEVAAHAATSTSSRVAASSARARASADVSATAMT